MAVAAAVVAGGFPAACDGSSDHDGDLLANGFELQIETDPYLGDTDLDGVEDGYEYQSALDLNHYPRTPPLPYRQRPYPNALDSTDAATDYDDDGLTLREEYLVWVEFSADGVRRAGAPDHPGRPALQRRVAEVDRPGAGGSGGSARRLDARLHR